MAALTLHPDRFFPGDVAMRRIARDLFARVEHLPLICPHGHADAGWFARDEPFADATSLLLWPDHYLLRTLYSQGITMEEIGVGNPTADRRAAWKLFATHYHVFRGTPSRLWLDHVFAQVFGMAVRLTADTADFYFDTIGCMLATPAFRPRALFQKFNIEKIATTEGALDALADHDRLAQEWPGQVITTYRPDDVIDPDQPNFVSKVETFCAGQYAASWSAYLKAHRDRRVFSAYEAQRRPTMVIPPRRPRISHRTRPRRYSTGCSAAGANRAMQNFSAPRC
jgi:glucuronate isomerase